MQNLFPKSAIRNPQSAIEVPLFSVIMPAYNEGKRIRGAIERTHRHLNEMSLDFEIIVVDDGSTDDTAIELSKLKDFERIKVHRLPTNCGKGEALRQGYFQTKGQWIFFLDADMDLPPEQMNVLIQTMHDDQADVVIGTKRHPRSKVDYPFYRLILSFIYYTITQILFGLPVRDTQTGLKLFRREVLEQCLPRSLVKAFAYDLELLVIAHHYGFRVTEAPVVVEYHPKYGNNGYIPMPIMMSAAIDTLAIFYRLYILRYYDEMTSK